MRCSDLGYSPFLSPVCCAARRKRALAHRLHNAGPMLAIALSLSLLIGVSLGVLGGGGSILTLPILVYVLGVDPKTAIAMSLVVVGLTSAVGSITHARAGRVRFRTGLVLAATAMAGAYVGGRVAHFIPANALLVAFGAVMLVTSIAMMRGRRAGGEPPRDASVGKVLAIGAAVGLVAGLVGAGGGFLIVPALALFGGLAMPHAVGTSLMVIALQSLAGFAGHAGHAHLDLPLTAVVTSAAIAGSFVGARLAKGLSPDTLRRGFGWFVLVMAIFLLGKQLPVTARNALREHLVLASTAALATAALAIALLRRARHHAHAGGRA